MTLQRCAGFDGGAVLGTRGSTTWYARRGKRAFDFVAALVGLALLSVPLLALSLAILVLDGPPVLFRQKRVGRAGTLFTIYKFRTMAKDADQGSFISLAGDSRITPLGRWLRRFKLDELPQLWNVLRGEMGLVGPRPDVPGYLDRLQGADRALWEARPGITGPATLLFRREEEMLASTADYVRFNDKVIYPEKVRLNLACLNQCSFSTDMAYVLATVAPPVARRLGINRYLGLDSEGFERRMSEAARKYSVNP